MTRIRRAGARRWFELTRRYELELEPESGPPEHAIVRRGVAFRRLEHVLGTADAWSFIAKADRRWADGHSDWVELEERPG